jgi:hypothetical protein
MTNPLIRTALRSSLAQVRHVRAVRPAEADQRSREGYAQVERDLGLLAPQIALHSPAPDTLAASWILLRETLIASRIADRTTKEAVAAIVALGNSSRYLTELHTATMDAVAESRTADDPEYDHTVRAVADWARASRLRPTAGQKGHPDNLSELIGVLVAAHYLTRMANVFLPDSPVPGLPAAARTRALALLGHVLLPAATARHTPGAATHLLPPAPAATGMAWAASNPAVADAFARATAAIEAAGRRTVPHAVQELLKAELSEWDGRTPNRAEIDEAVRGLPFAERPAARLALLTAMASAKVDDGVVADYRRFEPDDRALIELTSWASLTAARAIGEWTWAAARPGVQVARTPELVGR